MVSRRWRRRGAAARGMAARLSQRCRYLVRWLIQRWSRRRSPRRDLLSRQPRFLFLPHLHSRSWHLRLHSDAMEVATKLALARPGGCRAAGYKWDHCAAGHRKLPWPHLFLLGYGRRPLPKLHPRQPLHPPPPPPTAPAQLPPSPRLQRRDCAPWTRRLRPRPQPCPRVFRPPRLLPPSPPPTTLVKLPSDPPPRLRLQLHRGLALMPRHASRHQAARSQAVAEQDEVGDASVAAGAGAMATYRAVSSWCCRWPRRWRQRW